MDADAVEAIMAAWNQEYGIRTERLEHNHIFQDYKVPGCLACDTINPKKLTYQYIQKARYAMAGGWF